MSLLFIMGMSAGIFIFFGIISLIFLVFWIVTVVDIVKSNFKDPNMKLIWILIVIFTNTIGAIIYWLVAPNQKIKNFNQFNHFK